MHHPFKNGDRVEVLMRSHPNEGVWSSATVIRSVPAARRKGKIYVEFDSHSAAIRDDGQAEQQRLREYVELADVRPAPPQELNGLFEVGDAVEVYCFARNGWRKARVLEILENSRYAVSFCTSGDDDRVERTAREVVEQRRVRVLREWGDGSWVPPFEHEELSPKSDRYSNGYKLKITGPSFAEGTTVEVSCHKEGSLEVWYPATVVKSLRNGKYLIEYQTLRTEDKSQFLMEEVMYIRPVPPTIQQDQPFECFAQVEGWDNEGWMVGYISKVIQGAKYMVCFRNTSQEMVFGRSQLRPRQDWVDRKWITASSVKTNNEGLNLRKKSGGIASKETFRPGMIVEVMNDTLGYVGSWYTARILGPIGEGKFLFEYATLRTDDESEPLKETAYSFYLRPCPPKRKKIGCYKLLEKVDAWYNEGWWVGLISRILGSSKYAVYFWTSNEELEFDHSCLRPHQDWIGGKWTNTSRRKSKLLMKYGLGKFRGREGKLAWSADLSKGTKVEVRSDEEGHGWYPAKIHRKVGSRLYDVEYQSLTTDDRSGLLKKVADAGCLRPCPPVLEQTDRFKPLVHVDAWYDEGWWVGQVCNVSDDAKYMVRLRNSKEVGEFQHFDLRPHQDWRNQKWICRIQGKKVNQYQQPMTISEA